ncbi:probable helicase senataxin [Microplitis mediator]|uniref:probable helicase senataxin n=1 Tax=Microplitis mediator TaxID=375433 RepID=UPI002553754B|nr:probable helicase senataxin [Microplitis mediator]XP_057318484.1 probable helicase senataxin [Microplitis mediator]
MAGYCLQSLISSTTQIPLLEYKTHTCGNHKSNDIMLAHESVSPQHCIFMVSPESLQVADLGSTYGTFINGTKIKPKTLMNAVKNDVIGISSCVYRVQVHSLKKEEPGQKRTSDSSLYPGEAKKPRTDDNNNGPLVIDLTNDDIDMSLPQEKPNQIDKNLMKSNVTNEGKLRTTKDIHDEKILKIAEDVKKGYDIESLKKHKKILGEKDKNFKENDKPKSSNQQNTLDKGNIIKPTASTSSKPDPNHKQSSHSSNIVSNKSTESQSKDKNIKIGHGSNPATKLPVHTKITSNECRKNGPEDLRNKIIKNKDREREQEARKSILNNNRRTSHESTSTKSKTSESSASTSSKSITKDSQSSGSSQIISNKNLEHQSKDKNISNGDGSITLPITKRVTFNERKSVHEYETNKMTAEDKDREREPKIDRSVSNRDRHISRESSSHKSIHSENKKEESKHPSVEKQTKRQSMSTGPDLSTTVDASSDNRRMEKNSSRKSNTDNSRSHSTYEKRSSTPNRPDKYNHGGDLRNVTSNRKHSDSANISIAATAHAEVARRNDKLHSVSFLKNQKDNSVDTRNNKPIKAEKKIKLKNELDAHYYQVSKLTEKSKEGSKTKSITKDALQPSKSLSPNLIVPKKNNSKSSSKDQPLDFFLFILNWDPDWLYKKTNKESSECPIIKNTLVPHLLTYEVYADYYSIMSTFISLEMWSFFTKDRSNWRSKPPLYAAINKYSAHNNNTLTELSIDILCDKKQIDQMVYPKPGDLMELGNEGNDCKRMLAYIRDIKIANLTRKTTYNSCLKNTVSTPCALITYTMITKFLSSNIAFKQKQELRIVYNVKPFVQMIKAILRLQSSPLLPIIKPKLDHDLFSLPEIPLKDYEFASGDKLDEKQKQTILRITNQIIQKKPIPKICLIDGPPGCGKSQIIVNIATEVKYGNKIDGKESGKRILICASSDAAVDEITMRLKVIQDKFKNEKSCKPFKIVRVGSLESMRPEVRDVSLSELSENSMSMSTDKGLSQASIENEITELSSKKIKFEELIHAPNKKSENECKMLQEKHDSCISRLEYLKQYKSKPRDKPDKQTEQINILTPADVVICTLSSCFSPEMKLVFDGSDKKQFSVCIIDDATLSSEPESLLPLTLGVKQLILVGDSKQLPVSIRSDTAKENNYHKSLFSRIHELFDLEDNNPVITLDKQYRTASEIIFWPKSYFYSGPLDTLAPVPFKWPFYRYRVFDHQAVEDNNLISNSGEASFVVNLIYTIGCFGLKKLDNKIRIGVITPHEDQRKLIEDILEERLTEIPDEDKNKLVIKVNTIDSFQGEEHEIIIMSCVKSKSLETLIDPQRLCQSLTRAKYTFFLCGNFEFFEDNATWKSLIEDARNRSDCYKCVNYKMKKEDMKYYRLVMKPPKN